jgi:hypothetical protein
MFFLYTCFNISILCFVVVSMICVFVLLCILCASMTSLYDVASYLFLRFMLIDFDVCHCVWLSVQYHYYGYHMYKHLYAMFNAINYSNVLCTICCEFQLFMLPICDRVSYTYDIFLTMLNCCDSSSRAVVQGCCV